MTTDALYNDPELVQFYDIENGWGDDTEFCAGLAETASSILDLGCGTGGFAAAMAIGGRKRVVGVDPAGAMLDVARIRPGGEIVSWIEGDARHIELGEQFELVVLTGHAFQVFLTDADRLAVLNTIARHLAPGGRFVFDSRNPLAREWRGWTESRSRRQFDHAVLGRVTAWNDAVHDAVTGIVTYGTFYQAAGGREFTARSKIAFPTRETIGALTDEAGLAAQIWLGTWKGTAWNPGAKEIIPIGGLK